MTPFMVADNIQHLIEVISDLSDLIEDDRGITIEDALEPLRKVIDSIRRPSR